MTLPRGGTASRILLARGVPSIVVTAFAAIAISVVSVALMPPDFWLVVTLLIGALAVAVPRSHAAWAWMLIVAAVVLADQAPAVDGRAALALLGIHLVHVLSSLSMVMPWGSSIETRVLVGLAPGFLAIQLPSQLLLAGCLIVLERRSDFDALPYLAPLGAIAALTIIALLVGKLRGRDPR